MDHVWVYTNGKSSDLRITGIIAFNGAVVELASRLFPLRLLQPERSFERRITSHVRSSVRIIASEVISNRLFFKAQGSREDSNSRIRNGKAITHLKGEAVARVGDAISPINLHLQISVPARMLLLSGTSSFRYAHLRSFRHVLI